MKICVAFIVVAVLHITQAVCPDKLPGLQPWTPGFNEAHRVTIGYGRKVILTSSATVHSIEILNGGKLVIADSSRPIFLRAKHILIGNKGELHIGSPECPYKGNLTISLFGRSDDSDVGHSYFGRKYIGVGTGGTLEIHGKKKLSWTFLNKTLHPGQGNENSYRFEKSWGNRGIIIHVINPKTGEVLHTDRFDTYRSKDESRRLAQYVDKVETGQILAMVVNDEGSNNLEDLAKKALTKLGSQHFHRLGFRHPWSFITVKGDASSVVEDHAVYQGTKASSEARSSRVFHSGYGEHFTITTVSQWVQEAEWTEWFDRDDERGSGDWEKLTDLHKAFPERLCSNPLDIEAETLDGIPANMTGEVFSKFDRNYGFVCLNKEQVDGICHNYRVRFLCGKLVRPQASISIDTLSNCSILELADEPEGWTFGDRIVVASTDYSMHQAEEFSILPCPSCMRNQIKVEGKPTYLHIGEEVDGVDMRAEVGLLTRNILIKGEMEPTCYGNEACKFFSFDTFGGHLKAERGFHSVHVEGVEFKHMGQQSMGHYPVHFHMNGDVDEMGGYDPPTYVKDLSIHHTFSRCVTVHGTNGLLGSVKDVVGYDALGHCFFTEDGPEERNTFDHCLGLLVKASTLLPSDRDSKMCRDITSGAYPGYVAKPRQDCRFADNGIGLTLASDFPIRGMQIYDGPINVQNCTFRKFIALDGRHTSAFGFRLNNTWQSCPNNNVTDITFDDVPITSRVFFGEPGPWFNKMEMDGDKTTIFHDIDGSVSEYPGAFLVKEDNWLLRHPDCIDIPDWRAAICSGHYAQIYVQTRNPANLNMKMVKDEYPDRPLELVGALGKRNHYQQFQPVVMLGKGYTMHWDQAAPAEVTIWLINFNRNDWMNVGICYPKGTEFTIISDIHNRLTKETRKTGVFMRTTQREKMGHSHQTRGYYYWEEDTGLLFLKIKAHNEKEDFAFCSVKGCERVKIKALIPPGSGPSDCMAEAYPKYTEMPVVDVPMPKKLPRSKLPHTLEHFLEVKLESYNTRFFHIKEDFSYTEVNGKKIYQSEDGIHVIVIDGHTGKILESKGFRNSILMGVPAQLENYITNLKDESVVLITSKGKLVTRGPWTKILETLGADQTVKLKDKLAFVGFKGSFRPDWVRMSVDEERAKLHQVLPIPVVKMMKL
ncbi:cell migration-inducing and hyaluronan-binding [Labeo rohita]|uniref:hyaluronoglucosaminidase n=1 Tax=Labeo rohita TaxID=84645 RepID=A0A498MXV0_LABRO|nr:cell migration-inducing and hyaluronan-binding [Labeo rohita]